VLRRRVSAGEIRILDRAQRAEFAALSAAALA
jgi:hypothetical protein